MEAIAIIGVLTILAALITYWVRTLRNGKKLAKNDPYTLKKGSLVMFDDRLFEVKHVNKGRYNIRGVENIKESLLNVDRRNLIKA